jgi:hypothetical protein
MPQFTVLSVGTWENMSMSNLNLNCYLAGSVRIRFVTGMIVYSAQSIADALLAMAMPTCGHR